MKNFVAVRTHYYKSSKGKSLEWHIRRDNKNKNTASVFDEHSHNNIHKEIRSRASCRAEYKKLNGRKVRVDANEIFEHVLIFSREKFEDLEKKYSDRDPAFVHEKMCILIERYIEEIRKKHNFEPLNFSLHMDEGFHDKNGKFQRNIHAHVMFYNYNFEAKKEYLNNPEIHKKYLEDLKVYNNDYKLYKAEKKANPNDDSIVKPKKPTRAEFIPLNTIKKFEEDEFGKKQVNSAFSGFQDIAGSVFLKAGFTRGIKKSITNADHLNRDQYIHKLQNLAENALNTTFDTISKLKKEVTTIKNDFKIWLFGIEKKLDEVPDGSGGFGTYTIENISQEIADNLDKISDNLAKETKEIDSIAAKAESKFKPPENHKITSKRKRRRRVPKNK